MSSFPEKYRYFLGKIEKSEKSYHESIKNLKTELLTLDVHPEESILKRVEVENIQKEIEDFINTEVKAQTAFNKLQVLIGKSNILYNTSILHARPEDKEKVIRQVGRIKEAQSAIIFDVRNNSFINNDIQMKERLMELISYEDYNVFKLELRNSEVDPFDVVNGLAMINYFDGFDYVQAFKAFLEDELSDLGEIISKIDNFSLNRIVKQRMNNLYKAIIESTNFNKTLLDIKFWREYFLVESSTVDFLRQAGLSEDIAKIKILDRLNIDVKLDDLVMSSKMNAFFSAIDSWHETSDTRVYLFIKFIERLQESVTYKDLYFVAVLFNVVNIFMRTSNSLGFYMNKYNNKYHYEEQDLVDKKNQVIGNPSSKYALVFECKDDGERDLVLKTLESILLDFKVFDKNVYLNMLYFSGLDNIVGSFTQYL